MNPKFGKFAQRRLKTGRLLFMLDFRPPVTEDRKWVAPIISHVKRFGCDYSFGDMFIWKHVYNIRIASHDGSFQSTAPMTTTASKDRLTVFPSAMGI